VSAVEDIRIKLENRLNVLEQEIESLRCALTALDDEQAPEQPPAASAPADAPSSPSPQTDRAASPPATATRRRAPRRARASATGDAGAAPSRKDGADEASSAELERLLAETGGLTAVELARQTGTDYGEVLARIRQLERAGQGRR
jgi:phage shock protein A